MLPATSARSVPLAVLGALAFGALGACLGVLSPIPFIIAHESELAGVLLFLAWGSLIPAAAVIGGVCGVLSSIFGYRSATVRWALLLVAPVLCGLVPFGLLALWNAL